MPSNPLGFSGTSDDRDIEKRAIPKFASFRPHSVPCQEHEKLIDHWSRYGEYPTITSEHQEQRAGGIRISDADQLISGSLRERTAPYKEGNIPPSFVVDRVGDRNNLTFGTLHRHATPTYFRIGLGGVLGASVTQKIDRAVSNGKILLLSYNEQGSSRSQGALRTAASRTGKELKIKPQVLSSSEVDSGVDFISLTAAQSLHCSSDEEDDHYRYLGGKAKFKDVSDDLGLIHGSDSSHSPQHKSDSPSALATSDQRKRIELSKKLEVDPANADAWLQLIKQHDTFKTLTNAERISNADIKLSMYEKALNNVKDPRGREILLLAKMGEGAQVWCRQKTLSEWQSVLQSHPNYLELWQSYLDYRQTTFASFTYEGVRGDFVDCLSLLQHNKYASPLAEEERIYDIHIYEILRMTLLMRESGFGEQAVSAWQSLLEYEINRPLKLRDNEHKGGPLHHVTISALEEFWDSEVPRIGEEGYRGWASFCAEVNDPPEPKTGVASVLKGLRDVWESWVGLERKNGLLTQSPARAIDDRVEDDPYRVVLFSDVRSVLIHSPSIESRSACLDAFLAFCRLPPCQKRDPAGKSRSWWVDGYIRNEKLCSRARASQPFSNPFPGDETLGLRGVGVLERDSGSIAPRSLFDMPMSDYQLSTDSLFAATGSWFAAFDAWQSIDSKDCGSVQKTWVLRSLKQLVATGSGEDTLAEYVLALELCLSPDTVQKSAKSLLKKRPSSLQLYNAYALIEYRLGNACKGENAIITSIEMTKSLGDCVQRDSILLWRTWIWELLSAGNSKEAFHRIILYGDEQFQGATHPINASKNQSVQPAVLLRTERALTATRDHMLSLRSHRHAALAVDCLVLFQYLQSSLSLSAASSAFKSNVSVFSAQGSSNPTTLEYLHQSFARLVHHHATHTRLVKPSEVRSLLAESITLFPQNTIFLSLYAWNEARFRIDDRVRSIVKDVVLTSNQDANGKHQSVISHFFAIYTELNRGITLGSNVSTIRSTFERAVGGSGNHCAGLWRLYVLFEHSRADIKRARGVFWRGVEACPWAKELYMLAFEYLRGADGLKNEDLRGVYELMAEKGIRIHVRLEDVFEAMDGPLKQGIPDI